MEIKNKLAVTRVEGEGDNRVKRRGVKSRNMYRGPMDKDNREGERTECGRWGVGSAGESNGGKIGIM